MGRGTATKPAASKERGNGMTTPVLQRELVGFQRVSLKPGKAGTLRFTAPQGHQFTETIKRS